MRSRGSALDAQLVEELAVQVGVAEADHRAVSPTASSAAARTSITSAVPSGAGGAEQLDAGLDELAHLAALRADRAVGAAPGRQSRNGRLRVGEAVGDQARDRDRHVRAQREQLAATRRRSGRRPAPRGRRRARAPPRTRSSGSRPRRSRSARTTSISAPASAAQLAHLVGEDVSGAWGNRVASSAGACRVESLRERPPR